MAWDANKGVHNSFDIYNGMPATTSVNNPTAKGWIQYRYTVTGQKLSAAYWHDPSLASQPISGSAFTQADIDANNLTFNKEIFYMGNMILENYGKKKLLLDNGYYDFDQNKYYFYVKDHLGNNRVVAKEDGTVVQQTDYYPFGMPTVASTGEGVQPYKFEGKEYDTNSGLDQYDFHARQYDPILARFTSMDPHAENYFSWSPYAYCANNPLRIIDPNGKDWFVNNETGNIIYLKGINELTDEHRTQYELGNANYENLGADNMFGDGVDFSWFDGSKIVDYGNILNYNVAKFDAFASIAFMSKNGYLAADRIDAAETHIELIGGGDSESGKVSHDHIYDGPEVLRKDRTFVKPDQLNTLEIISTNKSKSLFSRYETIRYQNIVSRNGMIQSPYKESLQSDKTNSIINLIQIIQSFFGI